MYHAFTRRKPHAHMKLVTLGEQQKIIGIHVIGEGADEMMQGFAVALRMGAPNATSTTRWRFIQRVPKSS